MNKNECGLITRVLQIVEKDIIILALIATFIFILGGIVL